MTHLAHVLIALSGTIGYLATGTAFEQLICWTDSKLDRASVIFGWPVYVAAVFIADVWDWLRRFHR